MAVSSSSDKNTYTLREFVEVFELPKSVRVTKGQEKRNKNRTIKKGQVFLFDCVSKVNCLSGVTSIGEHKVWIPIDCQQRVEALSPCSMDEPAQTIRELLARSRAPEGMYVRVVNEKLLSDKQVLKAGEILKLLSVDDDGKLLTTIDNQGCIFHLPLSRSVGFHLLQSAGEEYLLADLIAKDLLPTYVRFVDPVSPEVRRTFIEEDHEHSLGAVYLERAVCEQRGIEVSFDDTLESWTRISWLPIDIDITVAELGALDTELDITDTDARENADTDDDIFQPYEAMVGPNVETPLPHRSDDECNVSYSEGELASKSISGMIEASSRGQLIDPTYEVMFDTKFKQPLPRPNDGEYILTSCETELESTSGKTETSTTPRGQLIDPTYEVMFDTKFKQPLPRPNDGEYILTSCETELESTSGKTETSTTPRGQLIDPTYEVMFDARSKQPLPRPNNGECILTSETELESISEKAETNPKGIVSDYPETKRFLKQFVSLPNLRNLRQRFTLTRNKETDNNRGTIPGAARRKSTDPLPAEPNFYEEVKGFSPKYGTLSDIPSDLTTLTKEDVSSLLQILNLGEYAARFYHNEVDGCRLVDLNIDILVISFGLNQFHALKLSKFVTGWRPCYSGSLHRAKDSIAEGKNDL